MITQADLVRAILEDEVLLEAIARLLHSHTALAGWPDEAKTALALALAEPSMPDTEGWKAVTLRRHLFGPRGAVPEGLAPASVRPDRVQRAGAERVRADLPSLVKYRAGMYLVVPPTATVSARRGGT